MAVRRSITCTCICSAGGRSGPWFRAHKYQKKRRSDEEEEGRAGQVARRTAPAPTEARGGQEKTQSRRGKIRGTPAEGASNIQLESTQCRSPRTVSASRALSARLPARLGRP